MIDPAAWTSSVLSSSPTQAPDRDLSVSLPWSDGVIATFPSIQHATNVDTTVSAKPTPAPVRSSRPSPNDTFGLPQTIPADLSSVSRPPQVLQHDILPATRLVEPASAAQGLRRPRFGTLATAMSDDITSFSDEGDQPVHATKRNARAPPLKSSLPPQERAVTPRPFKRLVSPHAEWRIGSDSGECRELVFATNLTTMARTIQRPRRCIAHGRVGITRY